MPVAVRACGLAGHLLPEGVLVELDRAHDRLALAVAARAVGHGDVSVDAIEHAARTEQAGDLAVLARWSRDRPEALAAIELDEDRHSIRALVRGLVAQVPAERRLDATVATARLPVAVLAALAAAPSLAKLAAILDHHGHPLAAAIPHDDVIDVIAVELALAHGFARGTASALRDLAMRTYVHQLVDVENGTAMLLFASRGGSLEVERAFVAGGARLTRDVFVAGAHAPLVEARARFARAFAGTPLAVAADASAAGAIENAALGWQLATQLRLRRTDPHGLAPVLAFVLRRRAQWRRLRRAVWRIELGGAT